MFPLSTSVFSNLPDCELSCDLPFFILCKIFLCLQAYNLITRPKGLALILSNVRFSSETDLEFRSGGDVDYVALDRLFVHLGYQVILRHDQTAQVSLQN